MDTDALVQGTDEEHAASREDRRKALDPVLRSSPSLLSRQVKCSHCGDLDLTIVKPRNVSALGDSTGSKPKEGKSKVTSNDATATGTDLLTEAA